MKAVLQKGPGGADRLYIGETQIPVPGDAELLVRVAATALNRADILQREGKYPPPPGASQILGLEVAGTVEAVGKGVSKWRPGDRVFGLVPGGAYAQYAVLNAQMAMPVPAGFTFEMAASLPEVFLTAFQSLRWLAELKAQETVLIHAGGSGVGTASVQLARAIGARPVITASRSKHPLCLQLGAVFAFDYTNRDFWKEVWDKTGGVDVIVDPVGAPYFAENLKLLKTDGRLVMLAVMGGLKAPETNLGHIVFKRLRIIGSTLRSRSLEYQIRLTQEFHDFAKDKLEAGVLKPVIDTVFDMEDIREAHEYLEANRNTGKVVVRVS